jgi:hypothetical protein
MISFKQYIIEARPTGQKRYQRDTKNLETRLDKMYASGISQKKIDRGEMRLARRTGEGEYDVEDINLHTKTGQIGMPIHNEDDPRTISVEDLMRMHGSKASSQGMSHKEVGSAVRSGMNDILTFPVNVQPGVKDEDIGKEAHIMATQRQNLINLIKSKKNKK